MVGNAKVVQFDPHSRRRDKVLLAKLGAPGQRVLEKGQLMLSAFFRVFFESVEDRIFDMADAADDVDRQNSCFEAMRSLRLQRTDILVAIEQGFSHSFVVLLAGSEQAVQPGIDPEQDAQGLSSIHDEQLEEVLAQESFINSVTQANQEELERLTKRFNVIAPKPLCAKQVPFSPYALVSLVSEQLHRSDLATEVSLLIYSELERKLGDVLPALYSGLNQVLAESGILPNLELKALKEGISGNHRKLRSVKSPSALVHEQLRNVDERVATVIESLVEDTRRTGEIPSQVLVGLLTTAQHSVAFDASMLGQKASSVVANILKVHGATGQLSRKDKEAIKLVGIMFECLFREHSLSLPVKMHINRLQIPIIKTAILDKTLFTDAAHPAKLFLNYLAKVGQSLGAEDRAVLKNGTLFEQMQRDIDTVMNEYDTDVELFDRLSKRLMQVKCKSGLEHSTQLVDEGANGQAKAAVHTLLKNLQRDYVSSVINYFVDRIWQRVLLRTHAEYGEDSYQWREAVQTLEQLYWSLKPDYSKAHRDKLIKILPELNQKIYRGLQKITYNPYDIAAQLSSISQLHFARIQGQAVDGVAKRAAELASDESAAGKLNSAVDTKMEHCLQTVSKMHRGASFTYHKAGEEPCDCVLAAVIKQTDAYIFATHSGAKVAQMNALQFAEALRSGELCCADHSGVFDNALERVVTGLRRNTTDNDGAP